MTTKPEIPHDGPTNTTVLIFNAQMPGEVGQRYRERLAKRYLPAIHGYMRMQCPGDRELAEELAQDVLLKLFSGKPASGQEASSDDEADSEADTETLSHAGEVVQTKNEVKPKPVPSIMSFDRTKGSFRSWVKKIVTHQWIDYLRRKKAFKRNGKHVPFDDELVVNDRSTDLAEPDVEFDRGWAIGILTEALHETTVVQKYPFAPELCSIYADRLDVPTIDLVQLLGATDANHARGILFHLRIALRPIIERLIGEEAPFPDDPKMSVDAVFILTGLQQKPSKPKSS